MSRDGHSYQSESIKPLSWMTYKDFHGFVTFEQISKLTNVSALQRPVKSGYCLMWTGVHAVKLDCISKSSSTSWRVHSVNSTPLNQCLTQKDLSGGVGFPQELSEKKQHTPTDVTLGSRSTQSHQDKTRRKMRGEEVTINIKDSFKVNTSRWEAVIWAMIRWKERSLTCCFTS